MAAPAGGKRSARLLALLSLDELAAIDKWRYRNMIPSRAAAVRELLRRGLLSDELGKPAHHSSTIQYTVLPEDEE